MTGEYLTRMEANLDDLHDEGFQAQLDAQRKHLASLATVLSQTLARERALTERVTELEGEVASLANTCTLIESLVTDDDMAEA